MSLLKQRRMSERNVKKGEKQKLKEKNEHHTRRGTQSKPCGSRQSRSDLLKFIQYSDP